MEFIIGLLIGLSGGGFIGMVLMALCAASSRNSRNEDINISDIEDS